MVKKIFIENIPDSSLAEKWLSADVFVCMGQRYLIKPDGKVVELGKNGDKPKE